MIRPVYMITYIDQKLNLADPDKLRVEVDKKFNDT